MGRSLGTWSKTWSSGPATPNVAAGCRVREPVSSHVKQALRRSFYTFPRHFPFQGPALDCQHQKELLLNRAVRRVGARDTCTRTFRDQGRGWEEMPRVNDKTTRGQKTPHLAGNVKWVHVLCLHVREEIGLSYKSALWFFFPTSPSTRVLSVCTHIFLSFVEKIEVSNYAVAHVLGNLMHLRVCACVCVMSHYWACIDRKPTV